MPSQLEATWSPGPPVRACGQPATCRSREATPRAAWQPGCATLALAPTQGFNSGKIDFPKLSGFICHDFEIPFCNNVQLARSGARAGHSADL